MNERNDTTTDEWSDRATTADLSNEQRNNAQDGPTETSTYDTRGLEHTGTVGKSQLSFAGFWMRFWAYLADLVIVGSINRIIVHPIFKALDPSDQGWFSAENLCTAIVYYLYFMLMTKYAGQTLGKMIFGLKVVSLKEEKLSWGTVLFREFIGRFISKTIIIGYIIVGWLPKKQGLHDIFADTSVILDRR
ncbi:RDD family protein [Peribacillus glennii]|uniref:RDD family protein n=1 Tax=Peribacillus glennii TaxID=2303991 RepID=A0A372LIN7_9BACI|nr:RDD family protein [Peribacillus glennii]RFU66223.1 RDD family protein [Peribacillus glennii]